MKRYILLILLLPLLLMAQDHTCKSCGKPLEEGSYLKVGTDYFHPEHFTCHWCEKPIHGKYFESNGNYYDADCYFNHVLPPCAWCNKPLTDKILSFDGKLYHPECYRDHVALKCAICGNIIEESYSEDFWGNKFHTEHLNEGHKCEYCSRLISQALTGGGVQYSDNRYVCNLCVKSAVTERGQAKVLMAQVRELLWEAGIRIALDDIPLNLVNKTRMIELLHSDAGKETGFTRREGTYQNGLMRSQKFEIFILTGMPRLHFIATAAHELMHVWMHLNANRNAVPQLVEGSCNYASELVLRNFNGPDVDYLLDSMLKETDINYGEGYRLIRRFARKQGVNGWMAHLKQHMNMP